MALTKCKECGAQVSTEAAACPNCGAKKPKRTTASTLFIGALLVFVIGGSIYNSNQTSAGKQAQASQEPPSKLAPVVQTEAERAAAQERRLQEIKTSCTTGMAGLLADAKALLANNDPAMASARLALCNGVSTDKSYVALVQTAERERAAKNAKVERDEKARKKREGVRVGMSKEDVLSSSWGKPQKVNTTTTARSTREQWVYGTGSYLYFDNEVLTAIQN